MTALGSVAPPIISTAAPSSCDGAKSRGSTAVPDPALESADAGPSQSKSNSPPDSATATTAPGAEASRAEQRQIEELKRIDAEVRAHEAAHMAAAGGLARGGPSYSYTYGPDGRQYAVGGEVSIDTSPVPGNPQATLARAQQIQRAALAPADPSGQDQQVAAQAQSMAANARAELLKQNTTQGVGGTATADAQTPREGGDTYTATGESTDNAAGQILNLFA